MDEEEGEEGREEEEEQATDDAFLALPPTAPAALQTSSVGRKTTPIMKQAPTIHSKQVAGTGRRRGKAGGQAGEQRNHS